MSQIKARSNVHAAAEKKFGVKIAQEPGMTHFTVSKVVGGAKAFVCNLPDSLGLADVEAEAIEQAAVIDRTIEKALKKLSA
jgi:hypothetical protein